MIKNGQRTKKRLGILLMSDVVQSTRLQYTPSFFARSSLLSLQETGTLTALQPHTSARENLGGYLILVVEHGSGVVEVSRHQYEMEASARH